MVARKRAGAEQGDLEEVKVSIRTAGAANGETDWHASRSAPQLIARRNMESGMTSAFKHGKLTRMAKEPWRRAASARCGPGYEKQGSVQKRARDSSDGVGEDWNLGEGAEVNAGGTRCCRQSGERGETDDKKATTSRPDDLQSRKESEVWGGYGIKWVEVNDYIERTSEPLGEEKRSVLVVEDGEAFGVSDPKPDPLHLSISPNLSQSLAAVPPTFNRTLDHPFFNDERRSRGIWLAEDSEEGSWRSTMKSVGGWKGGTREGTSRLEVRQFPIKSSSSQSLPPIDDSARPRFPSKPAWDSPHEDGEVEERDLCRSYACRGGSTIDSRVLCLSGEMRRPVEAAPTQRQNAVVRQGIRTKARRIGIQSYAAPHSTHSAPAIYAIKVHRARDCEISIPDNVSQADRRSVLIHSRDETKEGGDRWNMARAEDRERSKDHLREPAGSSHECERVATTITSASLSKSPSAVADHQRRIDSMKLRTAISHHGVKEGWNAGGGRRSLRYARPPFVTSISRASQRERLRFAA
ncbi:hypothetical protein R3P38DRAFT_2765888 [Favolaschia claudopus]|uniref:Uncharacterized protein n=1 Tax=Favolaschia claudopus TaxID=2862362 RepID=A0AAW0D6G1_9AGAR